MSTINDDALVARLVPKILSAIRAKSTSVETVMIKDNLDGITSMPCYDTSGLQYRKVMVAISTLKNLSVQASEEALEAIDGVRQENEETRISNEEIRIANEEIRVSKENEREVQFQTMIEHGANHPKIGENGYWWIWSESDGKYIDTGILAQGGFYLPTLSVDDNMQLSISSDNPEFGEFIYDSNTGDLLFTR